MHFGERRGTRESFFLSLLPPPSSPFFPPFLTPPPPSRTCVIPCRGIAQVKNTYSFEPLVLPFLPLPSSPSSLLPPRSSPIPPPLRPLLYLLSLLPPDLARTPPSGGHPPKSGSKEWMFLTCAIPRQGITQVPFRWHKSDVQIHTFCSPLALCDADLRDPPAGDHTSARFR